MAAPLNVALLGSGLFATGTHAPLLRQRTDVFCCKAVWSRSEEKAKALAATFEGGACDAYADEEGLALVKDPGHSGDGDRGAAAALACAGRLEVV